MRISQGITLILMIWAAFILSTRGALLSLTDRTPEMEQVWWGVVAICTAAVVASVIGLIRGSRQ